MIKFDNGGTLIEHESELPDITGETIYLDLETTSGDKSEASFNPWHKCWVLGICLTVDDNPNSYYVPLAHHHGKNLDAITVQQWLLKVFSKAKRWVNQNVKYDAQVLYVKFGIDVQCELFDLIPQFKLLDSDRFHYDLTALSQDYLHENIKPFEDRMKPYLERNKDYAAIPSDILGEYGCQDVITARRLHKFIEQVLPAENARVRQIEIDTTKVLVDIERNGLKVKPQQLLVENFLTTRKLINLTEQLATKVGWTINPTSNPDCFDVLCNKFGLPVLAWTDPTDTNATGNPSFDKDALKAYKNLPGAPIEIIELIEQSRKLGMLNNLFIEPWIELQVEGLLHSSYNQTVRTGRMSCKQPNAQQLMLEAKALITCDEDEVIISSDYAQIEFRLIVHYIRDYNAIKAYRENPETDFHQWVSDMIRIHRKPAKQINFLMGYGGGKNRLIEGLMQVPELVGSIQQEVDRQVNEGSLKREHSLQVFNMLARQRATDAYIQYHDTLPGLKRTSREAEDVIKARGYCRNLYGRFRKLPITHSYKAFNTLCQGSAADMMKERLIALWLWLKWTGLPIQIIGVIHDEVLLRAKRECVTPELLDMISYILEDVGVKLRVPIRTAVGVSGSSWLDASKQSGPRVFDRTKPPMQGYEPNALGYLD